MAITDTFVRPKPSLRRLQNYWGEFATRQSANGARTRTIFEEGFGWSTGPLRASLDCAGDGSQFAHFNKRM